MNQLPRLRRIRWAVRVVLLLGIAASVAANVLHALPNLVSQLIAAWPPVALLLTVDIVSRVPTHRRFRAAMRIGTTVGIACIAAWISYWHMAGVANRYGESGASPYLMPLSVDGLVLVASVSLVELAGRIRAAESAASSTESAQVTAPIQATDAPRKTVTRPGESPRAESRAAASQSPRANGSSGPAHRTDAPSLSLVSGSDSGTARADDADLIRDARDAVTEALQAGELTHPNGELKQRAAVSLIHETTGERVAQRRAVRIVAAIRDSRDTDSGEPIQPTDAEEATA